MTSNQICEKCDQTVKTVYNIPQPHTEEGKEYLPEDFILHVPVCSGKRVSSLNKAARRAIAEEDGVYTVFYWDSRGRN